jgi:GMP synthase (glutamine-hydrolysing)
LGPDRVHAAYVDTGLMREGETAFVREVFNRMAQGVFDVVDAAPRFLTALSGVTDPEKKRHIIGEEFVKVQEEILERGHFLDGDWILGQGTIYPDTIESGGTTQSETIKTHHNRVAGIQKLISENRIVEPLHELYKDEVRIVGTALGLSPELLHRHPFPGPGLAIRCLCSAEDLPVEPAGAGFFVPVRTVGVQGDSRTYRGVLALDELPTAESIDRATELINELTAVNRVIALCGSVNSLDSLRVSRSFLTAERLERLRLADAIVRRSSLESGFEEKVWQFPVVLIPLGSSARPDSVVLRPIHSVDGMTASAVPMEPELLNRLIAELLTLEGIAGVFYDLTHKPPATIEWE